MRQGPEADRFIDHLAVDKFAEIEDERSPYSRPQTDADLDTAPMAGD
jgi:hypothetical protein